jgi:hypothetical protein
MDAYGHAKMDTLRTLAERFVLHAPKKDVSKKGLSEKSVDQASIPQRMHNAYALSGLMGRTA